ncbi:MAG: hypothetical protein ACRBG0_06425 [Lewinella sp.]|jgi:hypothetical protein|uniref:hypothetical protein n=1 Tax=Lewinella sp. TaxID=2004506 RepID=UPI003D6C6179
MQALQQVGQLLVESKPLPALEQLLAWAREQLPEMVNDIELQMSRVNLVVQNFQQGLMTMSDYQTNLLQINSGILYLLDECKKSVGASTTDAGGAALHEYHAYTCDRVAHSDTFRQLFGEQKQPVQFYFLYGGDLQSHEGLFRRISYDLEGRLQDYLNPELKTNIQSLQLEMTFEFSRQLEHYKQNILRSFFSMLGLPPNEHEPLLEKDLTYALERSPRLQNLKPTDYVCVFLHISQYDWDPDLTPAAASWFIKEFCQEGKVNTPVTILFFLAIEYDEEDADLKSEILAALEMAERLQPLPELDMVAQRDIGRWLEHYKQVSPNSRTRKELMKTVFGNSREHYMEDVELELKKIIDQYNNNIVQ